MIDDSRPNNNKISHKETVHHEVVLQMAVASSLLPIVSTCVIDCL